MRRMVVVAIAGLSLGGCKRVREKLEHERVERAELAERAKIERAQRPPPPRPSGPGLAPGEYRLTSVSLTAMATKDDGSSWDVSAGKPDLTVELVVDGALVYTCRLPQDSLGGGCAMDIPITIAADSEVQVRAIDRDISDDDPVGTAVLADPSRWGMGITLPFAPAEPGQVDTASITIGPGPTWWGRNGLLVVMLFGAGGGAALWIGHSAWSRRAQALAIRRAEDAKFRRCAHCGTRLPVDDAGCSHCGAPQPPIGDAA